MIYFIQAGDNGPIKIGFTSGSAAARIDALQTAHYETLRLVARKEGGYRDEYALHAMFAAHRLRGEWFSPAKELLDFTKGFAAAAIETPLRKPLLRRPQKEPKIRQSGSLGGRPKADPRAVKAWKEHRTKVTPIEPLAVALKISKPAISKWRQVPESRLPAVASYLGLSKSTLRPDLFPASSPWDELLS